MNRLNRTALFALLLFACPLAAVAQDSADAAESELHARLGTLDWAVVALYALGMLAIGFYYSRRATTSDEYYLGNRKMKPIMVGLSLFATLISTISYLAVPGEIMAKGPVTMLYIAAIPIVYLVVGFLLIPHITRLPVTSAYELLESKFGRGVRLFGSAIFILIRLVWMGLIVFISARIVVRAVGLEPDKIPYVVFLLGVVTVVYSSMGGLQAVVLTDVIQSGILFGGALTCVIIVTVKMGGFGWFPTEWSPNWDTQPLFSFDPTVRVTVVGTILSTIIWWICTAGSDQMAIQRYLATRDSRAARRAFL
ncbi:MAG: Na+:solute symporter, partial [Candidatus Hydrogenedentes bacterium]|nr:Na+:solute symporter [Candidatus Hydrogenedentota bacterium]